MRLTCPNCAAQYEVPEDVIPAEGRDVQCSSCGQTWFQASARALAEAPPEAPAAADTAEAEAHPEDSKAAAQPEEAAAEDSPAEAQPAAKEPTPEQEPDTEPTPEPEVQADAVPEPAEAAAEEPEEDDSPAEEDSVAAPRARTLDPALSDILREEAERETALRTAERQSLETQTELGLQEPQQQQQDQDAAQRGREARDRMARLRGEDPRRLAAAESGSRRELLPDIEEINSTLRASGNPAAAAIAQPNGDEDSTPAPRRSGFARGFALSIFLGVLLVLAYDKSALITQTLPQAEPAVSSYVAWVDQARLWLDAQVQGLTAQ